MIYKVELTDTFGGEANYSWLRVYHVEAKSFRGAISKASRLSGFRFRKSIDMGDCIRYNAVGGCCVCAFIEEKEIQV